jgi:hypothetical protein
MVAVFAFGGVASAQADGLSYKAAKSLAKRLAEKQVRGRNVVSYHLLDAKRINARRIRFAYDDRSVDNVFCVAQLIVQQRVGSRVTTNSARFRGQRCRGIPSEVLKFEAITRQAQRDLRANTAATVSALRAVQRSAKRCRSVTVPKAVRSRAAALFDVATVNALAGPNDAILAGFVGSLRQAEVSDPTLRAGADAWADYFVTLRALPQVTDPCAALRTWARAGYRSGSAPIDFAAFRALDRRATRDSRVIVRAADLMAARGAFPNAVLGFTPTGLLRQLGAKAGITGGTKGKLVLGS